MLGLRAESKNETSTLEVEDADSCLDACFGRSNDGRMFSGSAATATAANDDE
jgi:hypothetical protein